MGESDADRKPVSRGLLKRFSADLGKAIAMHVQAPLNSRIKALEERLAALERKADK